MSNILYDTLWNSEEMALAINPKQVTTSHGVVDCGKLSAVTCKKIIDESKNPINKLVKGRIQDGGKFSLNEKIRQADIWVLNEQNRWIDEIIISTAETALQYLDYDVVGLMERPQLMRYTSPSIGYNWHIDLGQDQLSTRKLSISITLNEDFTGGDLLFFSDKLFRCPLPKGQCIAFPSFLSHKVMPIRTGVRWALVCWISGHPFR